MSHAVVRGAPLPAQRYLDNVLDDILRSRGQTPTRSNREGVNLAQILFHCLKTNPEGVFMINGHTGEVVTNRQMLKDAISLARVLIARGARGRTVTVFMRNHQRMIAAYLGVLFAQTLPFMQDPTATVFELTHFLKLIEPSFVFCDEEHEELLTAALETLPELDTELVVMETKEQFQAFAAGYSGNVDDFEIPSRDPESPVMLLPTSGSTGLPKAAIMTEKGLVAQLPGVWLYHTKFPKPTELMMVLTTLQWMTFTMTCTSGVVYQIPLLISPKPTSVKVVKDMLIKYRPTWTFFGPAFVKTLLPEITSDHFSSLKTLTLLGAPATLDLLASIQDKLPKDAQICDGYGTTEAQGYIALTDRGAPLKSNGPVINILHYKILDSNGKEVGLCQSGELYVKGVSCIQGYYKNKEAYEETFTNGWYRTGDAFYIDENERLSYLERIKFSFKFNGCHVVAYKSSAERSVERMAAHEFSMAVNLRSHPLHSTLSARITCRYLYKVSPEEVEAIINSLDGVQESVVCGTDFGPAAAVVVWPGRQVTTRQIHKAVDANLSEHKRLHGGIAFVPSLPHISNGKLKRGDCKKLVLQLVESGACQ